MRRHLWKLLFTLPLVLAITSTVALQDDCPVLVEQALQDLGQNCDALDRNSACYGYNQLSATFHEAQADDFFTEVSDRSQLTLLDTLTTTPLDAEAGTWGVAVLKVQANVPNSLPGQAVTFILLGDTEIRNEVSPADAFTPADPVDVTAIGNVNVRSLPSTRANVAGSVTDGTILPADGRSADGEWYRILFEDTPGWVSARLVNAPNAAADLPTITEELRTPMQAFYLRTGVGETGCDEAPDALVVQGPESVKVDLTVNGADISIGSTVVFRSIESTYGDLLSDEALVELYGDLLTGQGAPGDLKCNIMQIIVIDGDAELNEDGLNLPTGFTAQSINCGGADRTTGFMTPWGGSRPLTQEELDWLQTLNDLPPNILNYPIRVPTLLDIQAILQMFGGAVGDGGAAIPGPAARLADCSRFKPTSPLGGMPGQTVQFYWDPAPGATRYTVFVYDSNGAVVGEYSVDAPSTSVVGNPGGQNNMSWEVVAYVNGQVACTTARTYVIRDIFYVPPKPQADFYYVCVPFTAGPCPAGCTPVGSCGAFMKDTLCTCPT